MADKMQPCGQKTEVYSRVVGYHRPVKHWNKGKKEEFRQRKVFKLKPQANSNEVESQP